MKKVTKRIVYEMWEPIYTILVYTVGIIVVLPMACICFILIIKWVAYCINFVLGI